MTAQSQDGQAGEATESATQRVALSLMPATRLGKYNLIGKLGHGGMAEVYLAFVGGPAGFRKLAVIKRLHQHLVEEPGFLDMFLDEARLAARLNHPNVVQTHEVGEVDGSHFIAMEYLDGQALDRIRRYSARREVAFPPQLAARVAAQALEGLHYAHELADFDGSPLGVVHRDVSPQNVFVTYDGLVKLLDFGIAKAATHVVETRTGVVKGKFAYIAPEQARGRPVDRRADLWSMGVVLWEALAGRRLFKGTNDLATLSESLMGPIPRLESLAPELPEALGRVVARALCRDPEERYQSALEMRAAIDEYLAGEPRPSSRSDLGAFVKGLFGEAIEQHRKVLSACLSDSSDRLALVGAGSTDATPSGLSPVAGSLTPSGPTPPSFASGTGAALGSARAGWLGRVAFLLAAVALAMLSTCVVLHFYGPAVDREPRARSAGREEPAGRASGPAAASLRPSEVEPAGPASAQTGSSPADAGAGAPLEPGEARPGSPAEMVWRTAPAGTGESAPAGGEPAAVGGGRPRDHARPRRVRREAEAAGGTSHQHGRSQEAVEPAHSGQDEAQFGYLSLDTMPWSQVSLAGRVLGTTPLIRLRLPAGGHVLTLVNPEAGIRTTYRVSIEPGETTARRLGLE